MEIKRMYQLITCSGGFNSYKLHPLARRWGFEVNEWIQKEVESHVIPILMGSYEVKGTFEDAEEARAAFAAEHTYVAEHAYTFERIGYAFTVAALQQVILGRESADEDWQKVFENGDLLDYTCDVSELLDKWKADEEEYRRDEQEFNEFLKQQYPND